MDNGFIQISGASRSLHVQVAREIARKILANELQQNQIIPNEKVLCTQFDVSRTALREAVKLLTSKGLLESKPKVGTRVKGREHWNFLDSQLLDWVEDIGDNEFVYGEFLALRRAIEPAASALAAKNASAEQRVQLSATFQEMESIAENFDIVRWTKADLQFHRLIFLSTGNSFYLPFANIFVTMFSSFISHSSESGKTCIKEHRAIYKAIMAGNDDKARKANIELLTHGNHRLPTHN